MEIISSRSNPKIKQVRALHNRKERQATRLFLVEGIRHVGEATQAGAKIQSIIYAPELLSSDFAHQVIQKQSAGGVPCYAVTAEVFDSLAGKENPQGILAVVHQPQSNLDCLTREDFAWGVALVAPQDPGNLGAILRTVDAVGASGLLLLDSSVDAYHPSAVRASMGTLFWYPVVTAAFAEFAGWARGRGYHIYGTSTHGSTDYRAISSYQKPCILLMGSEREGLTPQQAVACDQLIRLPMHGHATSLNLAVATGVMLYSMLERFRPS